MDPTGEPTESPTESPTFGPASDTVVAIIFSSTLGGILALIVIYFILGYYFYTSDLNEKMSLAEERARLLRESSNTSNTGRFPLHDRTTYSPGDTFTDD
jgi:hypothetical protein